MLRLVLPKGSLEKATLDLVLGEMAKAPAGGKVLIVCHAHDEGKGLLMPLAAGAL